MSSETPESSPAIEKVLPKPEPKPELKPELKPETKPETKKNEKPTNRQLIESKIKEKLDLGFEPKDKNSIIDLRKIVVDELKISPNSRSQVKDLIKKELIARKYQIGKLGWKNEIEGLIVNLESADNDETKPANIISNSALNNLVQSDASKRGALPKTTTEQNEGQTRTEQSEGEAPKKMTATAQEKLIVNGMVKVLTPLYIAMGVIQPDESEKEDEAKPQTAKAFKQDMADLGKEINDCLVENNIQLPAALNFLALGISFVSVMVIPVVKFKYFSSKQEAKPEFDDAAEKLKVTA